MWKARPNEILEIGYPAAQRRTKARFPQALNQGWHTELQMRPLARCILRIGYHKKFERLSLNKMAVEHHAHSAVILGRGYAQQNDPEGVLGIVHLVKEKNRTPASVL